MSNFHKIFSCEVFHVFLNGLPMMVIAHFDFEGVKSYGLVCCVLHCVALKMP